MSVNWSKPIEAVHTDGRVVPVTLVPENEYGRPHDDGTYAVNEAVVGTFNTFYADGTCESEDLSWHIRNAAQQPRTAPLGGEVGPEVLHDFVRAVAALNLQAASLHGTDCWKVGEQAKALRALLPEPVDADVEEANRVEVEVAGGQAFDCSIDLQRAIALAAIKRGRALAAGDRP